MWQKRGDSLTLGGRLKNKMTIYFHWLRYGNGIVPGGRDGMTTCIRNNEAAPLQLDTKRVYSRRTKELMDTLFPTSRYICLFYFLFFISLLIYSFHFLLTERMIKGERWKIVTEQYLKFWVLVWYFKYLSWQFQWLSASTFCVHARIKDTLWVAWHPGCIVMHYLSTLFYQHYLNGIKNKF